MTWADDCTVNPRLRRIRHGGACDGSCRPTPLSLEDHERRHRLERQYLGPRGGDVVNSTVPEPSPPSRLDRPGDVIVERRWAKAVRKALKRGAALCCPDCDGQMCAKCSEATDALVEMAKRTGMLP